MKIPPRSGVGAALLCFTLLVWSGQWARPAAAAPDARVITAHTYVELSERIAPAVVQIKPILFESADLDLLEELEPMESGGSGFFIDAQGSLLTSHHVLEGQHSVEVQLSDGQTLTARVLGSDASMDIALLHVDSPGPLPFIALAEDEVLRVGQQVVAMGSPYGLEGSLSLGVISGLERDLGVGDFDNFIQTDALVNPGNSGGPLVNLDGEVIGMNTAIVATAHKIGFAIPVDLIRAVLPDLRDKGRIARGWVGVQVQRLTPELAESLGIQVSKGVLVTGTLPGSPAEQAQLLVEDVILAADGETVTSPRDLVRRIARTPVGGKITLTLYRDNKARDLSVRVAERMPEAPAAQLSGKNWPLGLELTQANPGALQEFDLTGDTGLLVIAVESGSVASEAGLRVGDLLIRGESASGERLPLEKLADFAQVVRAVEAKGHATLLFRRGPHSRFAVLKGQP
ncbi:MAG: trypsin-like peptidase domain-containing protein [Deltaproteobacteria bacterium]|nr:trypsin-like peptidase domain-containing protein [Deltaproteobacteria bacterium]